MKTYNIYQDGALKLYSKDESIYYFGMHTNLDELAKMCINFGNVYATFTTSEFWLDDQDLKKVIDEIKGEN